MSNTVDNRVVEMQFNNNQFERGIHQSLTSLEKFKQSLSFKGADAGISRLQSSLNAISFANLESALTSIESRFSTFGIIGMTAVQNITNRVMDLGVAIGKNLVNQIKQGGIARYQNIAQAKFQIEGLGASWEKLYADMDYAVDGTAYGIDEAAKVAASLSASGYEAGEGMKKALRGVSGVAAMTNSTYSEIGDIFTTIAGNGKLMTMQMRQLSFRGLNVAATLAKQLGYTEQEINELVSEGKIDFETFANAMDDAFGEHAQAANKTFKGALSNMKAALSRIGENFARPIYENMINPLNALRGLFNDVKKRLLVFTGGLTNDTWKNSPFNVFIRTASKHVTDFIDSFKEHNLSFISVFASKLKTLAQLGTKILTSKNANIFDVMIEFFQKSKKVTSKDFSKYETIVNVLKSFKKIGQALGNVFSSFLNIVKAVGQSFGMVFNVGDGVSALDTFADILLRLSEAMTFTEEDGLRLQLVLRPLIAFIKRLIMQFGEFVRFAVDKLSPVFSKLYGIFLNLASKLINLTLATANYIEKNKLLEKFLNRIKSLFSGIQPVLDRFKGGITKIVEYAKGVDPTKWGLIIAGAMLIKSLSLVNNFLKGFGRVERTIRNIVSIPKQIAAALKGLTNFTRDIGRVLIIKEIAIAILALAGSLALLTLVDSNKLVTATECLAALIAVIGAFGVAMTLMARTVKDSKKTNRYLLSLGTMFVAIGASVLMLAFALSTISKIDSESIWNNFAVLSAIVGELVAAIILLSLAAPQLSEGAFTIIAFSASIWIMAKSLDALRGIDVKDSIEKVAILLVSLFALVKIAQILDTSMSAKQIGGIIGMILAIVLLEKALNYVANNGINYEILKNNIDKFAIVLGSLIIFSVLLNRLSMITDSFTGAKSIFVMVASVYILTKSLQALANIDSDRIQQAITAYIIIIGGLIAMVKVLSSLNKMENDINKIGKTVLKMSLAIAIISGSLLLLSTVKDPSALRNAVLSILGVLIVTMAVLIELNNQVSSLKSFPILSVAVLISAIGLSLTALSRLGDPDKALQAAGSMSLVLLAVGEFLKYLGKINMGMGLGLMGSLYSVILLMISIAGSLMLLSAIDDPMKLWGSVGALISVFAAICAGIIALSRWSLSIDPSIFTSMIVMIFMLMSIAGSLAGLAMVTDGKSLMGPTLAIIAVLTTVTLAILAISNFAKNIGITALVGLGLGVAAILVIALSLKTLLDGGYDWESMSSAVSAMIKVMLGVVAALTILSIVSSATANIGLIVAGAALVLVLLAMSAAMLAFASSVKVITGSLVTLSKINYDAIDVEKLLALTGVLTKMGLVSYIAAGGAIMLGTGLLLVGAGVTLLSVGIAAITSSIVTLVKAFTELINQLVTISVLGPTLASGINAFSKSVSDFIIKALESFAKGIVAFIKTLSDNTHIIATAIKTLIVTIMTDLISAMVDIGGVLIDGLKDILKMLEDKLPGLLESLGNIIVTILLFIATYSEQFGYLGAIITITFLNGAINGLIETAPELLSNLVALAAFLIGGFADAMMDNQDVLNNSIRSIINMVAYTIMNVLDAMLGGALSKLDGYKGVMDEIAAEEDRLAQERQKMRADREDKAYTDEKIANSQKVKNANDKIAKETSNQTDIYAKSAKENANTYNSGLNEFLQSGKEKLAGTVGNLLPMSGDLDYSNLNGIGALTNQTIADDIENNSDIVKVKLSDIPEQYRSNYMNSDEWNLDETGQYMIKTINKGIEEEAESTDLNEATSSYGDFFGIDGEMSQMMGEGAEYSGDMWNTGLFSKLSDPDSLNEIYNATYKQGEQAKAGWDDSTSTASPAKEAIKRGGYWIDGLVISLARGNKVLYDTSSKNADTVMGVYEDTLNRVSNLDMSMNNDFSPKITPIVDYTNLNGLTDWVGALDNTTTFKMAADSQISINNSTQMQLANQLNALRTDINKLANTDFSHMMDGVNINVNADTTVDGTVLRKTASNYTIRQLNQEEMGYMMATGGRY